MATDEILSTISREAGGDLSSSQFRFVIPASDAQWDVAGAGVAAPGVLQNDPDAAGKAASIAVAGVSKVVLGATVAAGAQVMSDANGAAVTATATNHILGMCLAGGASGEVGEVLIGGKNIL